MDDYNSRPSAKIHTKLEMADQFMHAGNVWASNQSELENEWKVHLICIFRAIIIAT